MEQRQPFTTIRSCSVKPIKAKRVKTDEAGLLLRARLEPLPLLPFSSRLTRGPSVDLSSLYDPDETEFNPEEDAFPSLLQHKEPLRHSPPLPETSSSSLPSPYLPDRLGFVDIPNDTTLKQTPDTPNPRAKKLVVNAFSNALRNATAGRLEFQGKTYSVSLSRAGTFGKVFKINDLVPIVPDRANNTVLVKVFRDHFCAKGAEYTANIVTQYQLLRVKGFPVAQIFNADTAVQDGIILIERIPDIILPQNIWREKRLDQLTEAEMGYLIVVRTFFDFAVEDNVLLDLVPSNFKCKDGRLTFFDFREIVPAQKEKYHEKMRLDLTKALNLWSCGNADVRQFLLVNIRKMHCPLAIHLCK